MDFSGCSPTFCSTSSFSPRCACTSSSCRRTSYTGACCRRSASRLPLGNLFYAYLAYQLAKKEGRTDVTAMPYGPSVPHMFIVVFVIMLPTYLTTKDAMLAWRAGLAWCFIIGVIVLLGAFVGPWIRKVTPRAAMLGTLGRHFHRVHLHASGIPDVGGAVDRASPASPSC